MSKTSDYTETKCKRVINSVARVFKFGDMEKLTKQAYTFISMKMGFIAHYNHNGFKGVYEQMGLKQFAHNLICSESNIPDHNKDFAQRHLDGWFDSQYTKEETANIGETMLEIVKLAKEYLNT